MHFFVQQVAALPQRTRCLDSARRCSACSFSRWARTSSRASALRSALTPAKLSFNCHTPTPSLLATYKRGAQHDQGQLKLYPLCSLLYVLQVDCLARWAQLNAPRSGCKVQREHCFLGCRVARRERDSISKGAGCSVAGRVEQIRPQALPDSEVGHTVASIMVRELPPSAFCNR